MTSVAISQNVQGEAGARFLRLMLIVGVLYLGVFIVSFAKLDAASEGFFYAPGHPYGGDFINLWSVGQLILSGDVLSIYLPDEFMAYQQSFLHEYAGYRVWAYPPHSLLFAWLFSLGSYHVMFALWSVLNIAVLAAGAKRFGFTWAETALLVFSPASLHCLQVGQTGNLACGLLLLAMSGGARAPVSVLAAAMLTIKPQTGFLIPLVWLLRKRWALIVATGAFAACLAMLSAMLFGFSAWRDYLTVTAPSLSHFEQTGTGAFLEMIPSVFMSLRVIGVDGAVASQWHFAFALFIMAMLIWRLMRARSYDHQVALVLIATCLITPYLHFYDLSLLLAGALIMFRLQGNTERDGLAAAALALSWVLPMIIRPLAQVGFPISPAIILVIFASAARYGTHNFSVREAM